MKIIEITEQAVFSKDTELKDGVLTNVAILRSFSANSRRYTSAALRKIALLAEGIKSYINHRGRSEGDDPRRIQDMIGYFNNCRVVTDPAGEVVKGNLHYLPQHGALIESIAGQNPNLAGFSIHGYADQSDMQREGNTYVIDGFNRLVSIDLVSDLGAVSGLFESKQAKPLDDTAYLLAIGSGKEKKIRAEGDSYLVAIGKPAAAEESTVPEEYQAIFR